LSTVIIQSHLIVQLTFCQIIEMTFKTNNVEVVNIQQDARPAMTII